MKGKYWKLWGPLGAILLFFGLVVTDKIWEPEESARMSAICIVAAVVCFAIGGIMRTRDRD